MDITTTNPRITFIEILTVDREHEFGCCLLSDDDHMDLDCDFEGSFVRVDRMRTEGDDRITESFIFPKSEVKRIKVKTDEDIVVMKREVKPDLDQHGMPLPDIDDLPPRYSGKNLTPADPDDSEKKED